MKVKCNKVGSDEECVNCGAAKEHDNSCCEPCPIIKDAKCIPINPPPTQEKKRLFQVLDDMNVHDAEHKTKFVGVSGAFISADKVKQGAKISMGAEESVLFDLVSGKSIAILLIIDRNEYSKRIKEG